MFNLLIIILITLVVVSVATNRFTNHEKKKAQAFIADYQKKILDPQFQKELIDRHPSKYPYVNILAINGKYLAYGLMSISLVSTLILFMVGIAELQHYNYPIAKIGIFFLGSAGSILAYTCLGVFFFTVFILVTIPSLVIRNDTLYLDSKKIQPTQYQITKHNIIYLQTEHQLHILFAIAPEELHSGRFKRPNPQDRKRGRQELVFGLKTLQQLFTDNQVPHKRFSFLRKLFISLVALFMIALIFAVVLFSMNHF